ncbi:MAG: TIR domain-containing protein [Anaerolineae bacterium]|nr:TIR domain-containing protein [Anaerolineae bacterium]
MAYVFISYSRHDSTELAHLLKEKLEHQRISAFLDVINLDTSGSFPSKLRHEIEAAPVFLCLLGLHTLDSPYVQEEVRYAHESGRTLIPVLQTSFHPPEDAPDYIQALLESNGIELPEKATYFEDALRKITDRVSNALLAEHITLDEPDLDDRLRRSRERVLEKVRLYWVEGVLNKSLIEEIFIDLGLQERPDTVDKFRQLQVNQGGREWLLSREASILSIFDYFDGMLLILGEPGAGKTTLLLELARRLIERARRDSAAAIPIVLNLTTWKDTPFESWVVEELAAKYQVPRKLGQEWVEQEKLLLLLDGLDEVQANKQKSCTAAMNAFIQQYNLTNVVVCSRTAEFEALQTALNVNGAVQLRGLSLEQINHYYDQLGTKTNTLRTLIQRDQTVRELASSPLMLNIMTLAYQGQELPDTQTPLFEVYVRRMLARRQTSYTQEQILGWLAWLAYQMNQHSQKEFLIERLQPSWLPNRAARFLYVAATGIGFGVTLGLLISVSISTLLLVSSVLLGRFWESISASLAIGAILGFTVGLAVGMATLLEKNIKLVEVLTWSWDSLRMNFAQYLRLGLLLGVVAGLVGSVLLEWQTGVPLGFIVAAAGCLIGGFSGTEVDIRIKPNQGIRTSAYNALRMGSLLSLGLTLAFLLVWQYVRMAFVFGVMFGMAGGILQFGGLSVIKHIVLRVILWQRGDAPLNYARFLDHASSLILMRKVGGGYIFIHKTLQDYFASLHGS